MTKNVAVRTAVTVFFLLVGFNLFSELLYGIGQSIRGYYHFDAEAFAFALCGYLVIGGILGVVVSRWWRSRKTAT